MTMLLTLPMGKTDWLAFGRLKMTSLIRPPAFLHAVAMTKRPVLLGFFDRTPALS